MKEFFVIGYPIGHSVSPFMHNAAFKELGMPHTYSTLEIEPASLGEVIKSKIRTEEFGGASVTVPHKIEVMLHLDRIDESAETMGAVNTLHWKDGVLTGFNTDAAGGVKALLGVYKDLSDAKIVVLGAGGAANALATKLAPMAGELTILNRTVDRAKTLAERIGAGYGPINDDQGQIESADIIVNTTSIGMHPNVDASPVDKKYLHQGQMVYDIVYNPMKTRLMLDAAEAGAQTLGGLWMLVYQGAEAFEIWTGVSPSAQTMYEAAEKALKTS